MQKKQIGTDFEDMGIYAKKANVQVLNHLALKKIKFIVFDL